MLRIKLAKLKQVCVTAFIPRILKESKTVKNDLNKCSIDYCHKATHKKYKSTDSGSKDDSYSKRKAIIDQCFCEKPPLLYEKNTNEPLSKDKVNLYTTEDKGKAFSQTISGSDKIEQVVKKEDQRNAEIQTIVAKIEEVKLAHDTICTDKTLSVETTKTDITLLKDNSEETNIEKNQRLAQNIKQIDRIPVIQVDGAKEDQIVTPKISALLQHTNVQTTTGNIRDDAKEEKEKLAQHIVHIDKTPLVDIRTAESEDFKISSSVSEALQRDEDQATAAELEKEKLLKHTCNIAKESLAESDVKDAASKLAEIKQNANVMATTAKVEEEKLAQKLDHIEETPHVEAGVTKVEGFNTTPKILGHDTTPNLFVSEPEPEPFSGQPEQVNLDELAKKCLGKPDGDVDEILLKELKNISRLNSLKFDLPKDDSSHKYFSQILQNKTKDNNNIVFDISDTHLEHVLRDEIQGLTVNEMKLDNFHAFHLDTVPIVTTDMRNSKDELNKKYSADGDKNLLLDIPAVLDPYGMQAIPFYQYVSKENIKLKELQPEEFSTKKPLPADLTPETGPMNAKVILKREEEIEDIQEPAINNKLKDLKEAESENRKIPIVNTVESASDVDPSSKSTESTFLSESDISKLLEYKNVLKAQQESFKNMSPDMGSNEIHTVDTDVQSAKPSIPMEENSFENATHTVLTTTTPTPTDPFGNPVQVEINQGQDKPSDEMRTDTAISANQEPGEYFPTHHLNSFTGFSFQQVEYEVTDSIVTYTGVFDAKTLNVDSTDESTTDNLMSQSISYYSTFPQLTDFAGNPEGVISKAKYNLEDKECITHMLQPEPKQENTCETIVHARANLHNIQVDTVQPEPKQKEYQKEIDNPKPEEFHTEIFKQQPKQEGEVEASVIKDTPLSDEIVPLSDEIVPLSDEIVPLSGEIVPLSDETVPLSVLLRRVRERNRLEFIKSVIMETEVAKKPSCIPPLDTSKPKTTLSPSPCKPKPKEEEKCPNPCKPAEKKDPCAKFIPFFLHTTITSNLDVSIHKNSRYEQIYTYISLAKELAYKKLKRLSHILSILNIQYRDIVDDLLCARDFNPWVPIPSWPIPKVEKKRRLVCPREGCKLPVHPVRSNTDKPCLGMPKKISPAKTIN